MFRARHPHDDRLFDNYFTERLGEGADPLVAEHLADCAGCAARYDELSRFMDGLASDAEASSDAIFTADRLRAQQQHILRRIEHVGRSARVISFPGHQPIDRVPAASMHVPSRWMTAAAAAGLFIGVAMGASLGWPHRTHDQVATLAVATPRPPAHLTAAPAVAGEMVRPAAEASATAAPATGADDDAFLSDLEAALERTQTRELRAIDALTPHVREIREVRYLR